MARWTEQEREDGASCGGEDGRTPPAATNSGLRASLRILAAALVLGLSLLARETLRAHPPVAGGGSLSVALAPGAPDAPGPAEAPTGLRLKLEEPDSTGALPRTALPVSGETRLSEGAFETVESAHALVALSESQEEGSRSLFVTLARRAADGPGLAVTRTGERGLVQTKFGAVETLEATLVGGIGRVCTGFAAADPRPVRIEGWLCAPLGRPPEPRRSPACSTASRWPVRPPPTRRPCSAWQRVGATRAAVR